MKILLIIICCAIAFVIADSVADNKRLVVTEYKVKSEKACKHCRIAFLSDLHGNSIGRNNDRLVKAVADSKADIIIIGGDMITARPGCSWDKLNDLLKRLSELKLPVYYGMGNHEYRMSLYKEDYNDSYERLLRDIRDAGIRPLFNDSDKQEEFGIRIQGFMLERQYYRRFKEKSVPGPEYMEKLTGPRNRDEFRILLAHNPEFFDVYAQAADLVLSGHYHGGIVRLPGIGGMVSPKLTLFPKYSGGEYKKTDSMGQTSVMLVSRGLGSHTIPLRVFNPIELVLVDIDRE